MADYSLYDLRYIFLELVLSSVSCVFYSCFVRSLEHLIASRGCLPLVIASFSTKVFCIVERRMIHFTIRVAFFSSIHGCIFFWSSFPLGLFMFPRRAVVFVDHCLV